MNELPPLPAPYYPQWSHSNEMAAYTADQMREYAAAAVAAERERCAKVCESMCRPVHDAEMMSDFQFAAMSCAKAIRAASPETPR